MTEKFPVPRAAHHRLLPSRHLLVAGCEQQSSVRTTTRALCLHLRRAKLIQYKLHPERRPATASMLLAVKARLQRGERALVRSKGLGLSFLIRCSFCSVLPPARLPARPPIPLPSLPSSFPSHLRPSTSLSCTPIPSPLAPHALRRIVFYNAEQESREK